MTGNLADVLSTFSRLMAEQHNQLNTYELPLTDEPTSDEKKEVKEKGLEVKKIGDVWNVCHYPTKEETKALDAAAEANTAKAGSGA